MNAVINTVVVCDVLDNFGDAGFCLRLSRRLCHEGHGVTLIHNNPAAMNALLGGEAISTLRTVEAAADELWNQIPAHVELIFHPFGTSKASPDIERVVNQLKAMHAKSPWMIVDYLSAERWVEDFHWTKSISPTTGHVSTYVYPGFNARTGGLIHADWTEDSELNKSNTDLFKTVFVFCYWPERISQLISTSLPGTRITGVHALATPAEAPSATYSTLDFCPQYQFDARLMAHDFLFIRGEDSFVRAQLAGRPFVWQIYPTEDGAHAAKLKAFFDIYGAALSNEAKQDLWALWRSWNGLLAPDSVGENWQRTQRHHCELKRHALMWKQSLLQGPELVREILTHLATHSPT